MTGRWTKQERDRLIWAAQSLDLRPGGWTWADLADVSWPRLPERSPPSILRVAHGLRLAGVLPPPRPWGRCPDPCPVDDALLWADCAAVLRRRREALWITQEGLAAAVGASRQSIHTYEVAKSAPSATTLCRWVRAVGWTLADLERAMNGHGHGPGFGCGEEKNEQEDSHG